MTSTALPPLPFKVKTIVSWAGEEEGDLGFMENEIVQAFPLSMKVGGVENYEEMVLKGYFPRTT